MSDNTPADDNTRLSSLPTDVRIRGMFPPSGNDPRPSDDVGGCEQCAGAIVERMDRATYYWVCAECGYRP